MDNKQFDEVLDLYYKKLCEIGQYPTTKLAYLESMLNRIPDFLLSGELDKANRWLGFIQGVLWSFDIYTIDEMRTHNRPRE